MISGVPMIPVISSNVEALGHDEAGRRLIVKYRGGVLWEYDGVDRAKVDALLAADSVGSFLHREIRGKHDGRRVQ